MEKLTSVSCCDLITIYGMNFAHFHIGSFFNMLVGKEAAGFVLSQ